MSRKFSGTFTKFSLLSLLTFCLVSPCPVVLAAPRRPKVKTIEPAPIITEAYYDKTWRTWQVGSKKEKAEVLKELKAIVKKAPEEFMAHYYLGIMNAEEGSNSQALNHLETALLGFPKSADIHSRIGELLYAKDEEAAIDHFEAALKLEANNAKALTRLGIYQLESGDLDAALDLLTRARQLQPDNPEILRALGAILIDKNSAKEALPIIEQALLFDQKHAETHWILAKAYEKLEQPEKAAEHYALAKKLGRGDHEIKELIGYDLARSMVKSGKSAAAEAEYKKEIRKNSDPATGLTELALLYEDTGRDDDAIKLYLQAYDLNKALGSGVMKSVDIYLKREDYANAERLLEILKRDPNLKDQAKMELAELEEMKTRQEKLKLEETLLDSKLTDRGIEETYYEMLNMDKKDAKALEGLKDFYQKRGYYDEALSYFRKYNKVNPTTDYNRKLIEKDLKNRWELDNFTLFGYKKPVDYKYSTAADDDLMNMAYNGDNDRIKEISFQILLDRKEYKENRRLIEGLLNFYAERGRTGDALKCVAKMKRLGYYTSSEATEKRAKLRNK